MLQGRLKEQPTSLHSSPLTSDMVTWEPVINHLAYEKKKHDLAMQAACYFVMREVLNLPVPRVQLEVFSHVGPWSKIG